MVTGLQNSLGFKPEGGGDVLTDMLKIRTRTIHKHFRFAVRTRAGPLSHLLSLGGPNKLDTDPES